MEPRDPDIVIDELHDELVEAQLQRDEAEGRLEIAELEIAELRGHISELEEAERE